MLWFIIKIGEYYMKKSILLVIITLILLLATACALFDNSKEDAIQKIIDDMSIDEKIGQLIISSYNNIDEIIPIIDEYKLGGVILYKNNINTVSQTIDDINRLKTIDNKIPLFISIDQEGGRVNRLPEEMGAFDSAMSIGNKNNLNYAYESGKKIGVSLNQLGINLDFAPVLDIFSNPLNTVIGERSFGTNPDIVSRMGIQIIKGLHSKNIMATAKHFPGHGDTEVDSHIGLPVVDKTVDELNSFEFIPFKNAINNDIDMIMVAHIILSKVDNVPSTMSDKVITDILRDDLDYDGVVITDDMSMKAISDNYTIPEAAVESINAGCDIVLIKGVNNAISIINSIKKSLDNGKLTEERIDESLYRILMLKDKYKML
jgi:beta-N-acetylhexosaminidase